MSLFDFQRLGGSGAGAISPFPDPFMDYASLVMPETIGHALQWSEFMLSKMGIYQSALSRVVGFFLTDLKLDGASVGERDRYREFLEDTLGIKSVLRAVALDFLCYGNSFVSLIIPLRRYLSCKRCGFEAPIKNIKENSRFRYRWQGFKFLAHCPFCEYDGEWSHTDRRSGNESDIHIKRWNPKEMELIWDPYSDHVQYVWRIPGYYRTDIRKGELVHIERAPWEVISAVAENANLGFANDVIYHMKMETLAGIYNRGWGISPVLANFTQAWYVQVLHRCNEAIGMDYVFPLRMLSPDPSPGGMSDASDPIMGTDLGGFASSMNSILRHRKQDPMSWHVSPYPVRYQMMGAEANQMAPFQLLDQGIDTLLNSIGVPVEFYKGSMALQTAPAALRLMESNWSHLTHAMNRFLYWLVKRISEVMAWDKVTAKLERPSHADDLNRQLAKLQLSTSGQLSQTTGLKSIGVDFREEQKTMLEEQQYVAEVTQEAQEKLEASQMGKQMAAPAPPPGAAPPQGGAGGAAAPTDPAMAGMPVDPVESLLATLPADNEMQTISPPELYQAADTIAKQAMGLSDTQRISLLRRLKQKNQAVWSLVKVRIEDQRNQFRQQGQVQGQQAAQDAAQQSIQPPLPA